MPLSQKKKTKLGVISLYAAFTISLVGSLCGTFAWYTYGARASILYEGSSAGGRSGNFEIGLVGNELIEDEECELIGVYREDYFKNHQERYIYWANGEVISGSIFNKVMEMNGYAYQGMPATTVEKRALETETEVVLKNNPIKLEQYESEIELAPHRSYAYFEFVTRKVNTDDEHGEYLSHSVSVKSLAVASETSIHEGLRFIFDGADSNFPEHYLVNPSSNENGYDVAGGPLDLNDDGYYDFERQYINGVWKTSEFFYGKTEEVDENNKNIVYWNDAPEANNGHLPKEECGTFVSNHKKDIYAIDMERTVPAKINYFGNVGFISSALEIGKSTPTWHNYAFFNITLFLEGWDEVTDNNEAFKNFTFQLEFDVV